MTSIFLCVAAFAFTYVAGRRSLVAGLATCMTVGYFYGILRANVTEVYSHFIFDSAVVGLYAAQLFGRTTRADRRRLQYLGLWVAFLIGWPMLLFFVPMQDYAVQFVGLRGNVFMLPFILFGGRLKSEEMYRLTLVFAALNIIAFVFAFAEYTLGVERFYPQNAVTELIYRSVVDENFANPERSTALRVPATFTGSHAFAGMMVLTFIYLFGAWVQEKFGSPWQRMMLKVAMVASLLGVFMAAARSPVILLGFVLVTIFLSGGMRRRDWALWLIMLAGVGWLVSGQERLQRFMTLKDTEYVSERVVGSINDNFVDLAVEYPMGNGLGGGGTSMPYFLHDRVVPPAFYMENEYARIILEQGVFGLCLWLAFIVWVLARVVSRPGEEWFLGRRLAWIMCAVSFATGLTGTGLLTSIPSTPLLLLSVGWITARRSQSAPRGVSELAQYGGGGREMARQYG